MSWSSLSFPFGSLLTAAKVTQIYSNFAAALYQEPGAPQPTGTWSFAGDVRVGSGLFAPGSSDFGSINVRSLFNLNGGIGVPGVSSFGALNVASDFQIRGVHTKQLLQRVHVFDTTSRSSSTATFSSYVVASITPLSSLSQIHIRAGLHVNLQTDAGIVIMGSHLMRNPLGAATSMAFLTSSSANVQNFNHITGHTDTDTRLDVVFERVDSSINVDPKTYAVDWARVNGTNLAAVWGGYVTLEEWL